MSVNLQSWLEKLGLEQYAAVFSDHDVDFDVLLDLTSEDLKELGVSLGHRKRLLKAIASYSPDSVEEAVAASADQMPSPLEATSTDAERRQLTVMFCDLVGSTALSVQFDPEDLREIIAVYRDCCKDIVKRYGGFVARYMGDGLLVYFGYPQADELDAERAIRASLEIVSAVRQIDIRPELTLQVRVGIATGEVVVGDLIGEGSAQERAVVGETPNLAARLQALAEPDSVVISDTTRKLVGKLFEYADLGLASLKGFDEPVPVWQVGDELVVESRFEATHPARDLTALVGREDELELLLERWQRVLNGTGQTVLLRGEPGIGKSRLTQALRERLASEPHMLLRYFCVPYYQNSSLYPMIGQLERAARFSRDDDSEVKLDKLEALLAQSTENVSEVAPLFSALLSIPTESRYPPLNLSPERQKENTLAALEDQLYGLAREQPVLIIFEDLHWVDPTTLELLKRAVTRLQTARVLLLMTARFEFDSPWTDDLHVATLSLTRLGHDQGAELVSKVAGGKQLPAEVLELIVSKTDGVPLFVEELTKTVLGSALLDEQKDGYVLTGPLPDLDVPSTLRDSLMARLDRHALAKEVAQIGAAIGRQFSYELVSHVSTLKDQKLRDALNQLTSTELVNSTGSPPESVYIFRHALIQDAAYSSLLRAKRKTLHARIASALEEHFAETVTNQPELLAHHYTRADDVMNATAYWHEAGNRASNRGAHTEALKHFETGLDLLPRLEADRTRNELELRILVSYGLSLASTQGYATPEVEKIYERAGELCSILGDTAETFPITRNVCTFFIVRDDLTRAQQLAQQCVTIAEQSGEPSYLVEAYTALGYVECHRGNFEEGCRLLEQCLAVYEKHRGDLFPLTPQDPGVACGALRAIVLWFMGRVDESRQQLDAALKLANELNHPFHQAYVHTYCAMIAELNGEAELAQQHALETIRLSQENGFEVWYAVGTIHLGYAKALLNETEESISILEQVLNLYEATGARSVMAYFLTGLVEAYRRAGNLDAALLTVEKALAHAEQFGHHMYDSLLHRLHGELLMAMSDSQHGAAEDAFSTAIVAARRRQAHQLELEATLALHKLHIASGEPHKSREMLADVCSWFDDDVETTALTDARQYLGTPVGT